MRKEKLKCLKEVAKILVRCMCASLVGDLFLRTVSILVGTDREEKGNEMINFGSGALYIEGEKIGSINEAEVTCSEEFYIPEYIRKMESLKASFECICRITKEAIMVIMGVKSAVIELCPNKKVVHLALYGKKKRTRTKNLNRAIRILEKERFKT